MLMQKKQIAPIILALILSVACVSTDEWVPTNSVENVCIFAKFMKDIYETFDPAKEQYSGEPIKQIMFNMTFVKYLSEFANFRVLNNGGNNGEEAADKAWPSFYGSGNWDENHFAAAHFDKTMQNHIANKFGAKIFSPETPIQKTTMRQIMRLAFSLAIRILLSVIYGNYFRIVGQWQLDTLMSAYKLLTSKSDNQKNGIYPFRIIQIETGGLHFWAGFPDVHISGYNHEHLQHIANFEFIITLSECSLTYYEVYEFVGAILLESKRLGANNNNRNNDNDETNKCSSSDDESLTFRDSLKQLKLGLSSKFSHSSSSSRDNESLTFRDSLKRLKLSLKSKFSHSSSSSSRDNESLTFRDSLKRLKLSLKSKFSHSSSSSSNKTAENPQPSPSAFLAQIEQHLTSSPSSSSSSPPAWWHHISAAFVAKQIDTKGIDCALVHLGTMLKAHTPITHSEFYDYVESEEFKQRCGKAPHQGHEELHVWKVKGIYQYSFVRYITGDNTPAPSCQQVEMQLFDEPLWNYAEVIRSDTSLCKAVEQFGGALIKHMMMNSSDNDDLDGKIITKLDEFENLEHILSSKHQNKNYYILNNYKKKCDEEMCSRNEIEAILKRLMEEYSCQNDTCELSEPKNSEQEYYVDNETKFGKILFETLNDQSDNVNYDDEKQLLSFPLSIVGHILERFYETIKNNNAQICQFFKETDFVKALQNFASAGEMLELQKRGESISEKANEIRFQWLLSMAIRLFLQIKDNEFVEAHLKPFISAYKQCFSKKDYFDYKINIIQQNKIVEINFPTWKLPYKLYLENINDPKQEKTKKIYTLMFDYSPTLFEIIKMAKILNTVDDDGHFWFSKSDPKIFIHFLRILTNRWNLINNKEKVSIKEQFCVLAYFVTDLLVEAADKLPSNFKSIDIEIVNFLEKNDKLCQHKNMSDQLNNYFGVNIVQIAKAVTLDLNPSNDIQQILPSLLVDFEQMIMVKNYKYALYNYERMIEWNLLEFELKQNVQGNEMWDKIDGLRNRCNNLEYKQWKNNFTNENNITEFEKMMEELGQSLKELIEDKQSIENKVKALLEEKTDTDIQKIVPKILAKIEEMKNNKEFWYISYRYFVDWHDWNLLEYELMHSGQAQKWVEIVDALQKQLTYINYEQWESYSEDEKQNAFKDFEKIMEKLKQKLDQVLEEDAYKKSNQSE